MRRGTTPTLEVAVGADLTGWTVYLTVKYRGGTLELTGDRLAVAKSEGGCKVTAKLTQEETLAFPPEGTVSVQVRATDGTDAVATEIGTAKVGSILKEGVI